MGALVSMPGVNSCAHCRYGLGVDSSGKIQCVRFVGQDGGFMSAAYQRSRQGDCGMSGDFFEREPGADDA